MPEIFGLIPWGHHIQIISNCKSLDEAIFYTNRVIEEGGIASYQLQEVVERTIAEIEMKSNV